MAKLGQTNGHVKQTAFSNRVYQKTSLRKAVIRHPGVLRRSTKVIARNEKIEASPPAKPAHDKCIHDHPEVGEVCPWDMFVDYLSDEMKGAPRKRA